MGNVIRRILILVWWLPLAAAAQMESFDVKVPNAIADSSFHIEYIVSNTRIPGYLDVHVKFMTGDSVPSIKYLEDSLKVFEVAKGSSSEPARMETQKVVGERFDVVTVLMDISSSMWREEAGRQV